MQYLSITLCKYKRLALNHIDYIQITPQNKIQLILGTNGSGKSSILSQLTPLPANHQDFHKDGYKVIELLHNNSHYTLKSIFASTGNKYHFIKDDKELNDGFTQTTFKELVRQEFNITQDVHDLMTGSTLFHQMSVSERRNWFTKISDSDYTYAISYYKKLKEQHRDMLGAIKLHHSRLIQESEKLLTPKDEEKYRYEISIFNDLLSQLLELKTPTKVSKEVITFEIQKLEDKLIKLTQTVKELRQSFPNIEGFKDITDIDNLIVEKRSTIQVLETDIEKLCNVIEEEDNTLQTIKNSNVDSLGDIDNTIDLKIANIQTLKTQIRLPVVFQDPENAIQALMSVTDNLSLIANELVVNADRKYSRDNYLVALETKQHIDKQLDNVNSALGTLAAKRKELEHYKTHNKVECPKCSHTWFQGYDDNQYKLVLEQQTLGLKKQEKVTATLNEQCKLIEDMKIYLELYRNYIQVSKAWPILNPLWDYLSQSGVIFDEPNRIKNIVQTLQGDLQVAINLKIVNKQLQESLLLKETLHKNQETSIASFIEHSEQHHKELFNLNSKLQITKRHLSILYNYKEAVKVLELVSVELEQIIDNRQSQTEALITIAKTEALNTAIQSVQMELYEREQTISKIDIQRAVIANIQLQILELTEKSEVLKIAIDELSPSQGLIAKGLTGFINHFVAQINSFIKKIWLYPMELIAIVPDEDESIDLDYKFSVRVNDEHVIPDISKGSAGMREIIDLAFKIVSMQYLGLDKAPLILDEFSISLDSAHRQSAQFAITNLMNNSNFSQVFMVSHYENAYGSLKNADICVLHPSNINISKDMVYNRHCVMK